MNREHLIVALVNDGSGFRLHLESQEGHGPEVAAARFLARQDMRHVAVYEYAVLEGRVEHIEINPIRPGLSLMDLIPARRVD